MEKYVLLNLRAMRVIGVWYPEKSSSFEVKVFAPFMRALTIASILFIIIPAATAVKDHLPQFNLFTDLEVLTLLISATVIFCKTLNIILRRNKIRVLLNEMSGFWREAVIHEVESMTGIAEVGKKITKWYFALGFFNIVSFSGQPFLSQYLSGRADNSSVLINRMPFDGWENFMAVNHPTSVLVLVYIGHVIAVVMGTVASIGHDCLFVVLILHVCANLRGITTSLIRFQDLNDEGEVEERIIRCGKTFRNLIEYTKELENMLSVFLLAQCICSTFIICLTTFLVSRDLQANKEIFKYMSFWAGALFQLFIFCWAANCLQTEANKVGESAYEAYGKLMSLDSENELRNRHFFTQTPQNLQMILLRSQIPPKITAGHFYVMSLDNYKNVLSTSYSYFTILRAFADKKN